MSSCQVSTHPLRSSRRWRLDRRPTENLLECLGIFSNLNSLSIAVGEPAPSFAKSMSMPYPDPRFGSSGFHPAGLSGSSLLAASNGSLSTSGWTLPSSSMVGAEPLYTAVNTDKRATGSGHANEDEYRGPRTTGAFQAEGKWDEDWPGPQALQNPNFWKDMMMPGYVYLLFPAHGVYIRGTTDPGIRLLGSSGHKATK